MPISQLVEMLKGSSPQRCVRITASQLSALAEIRSAQCPNRGEMIRVERCESCPGNVRLKVFECRVWGECTTQACQARQPSSA
jgi:hypothetical protein